MNFSPASASTPSPLLPLQAFDSEEAQRFRILYKARFGVDSKPEYDAYIARRSLSAEQGVQLMEDIDTLLHHVFDAVFETRSERP